MAYFYNNIYFLNKMSESATQQMSENMAKQVTLIVKTATYKLLETRTPKCYVSEMYNYVLTGYNPESKFTESRSELLAQLSEVIRQIIVDSLKDNEDENITEEKIEQSAIGFTNQFMNIYLNENKTFPIQQWEGATPVVEDGCVVVNEDFYVEVIEWLRRIGYNILLRKY